MFLSNCFCLQVAQPADEPERRPGQPASVAPPSNDAIAARPAQASRRKPATTREALPPNDASTRKGVTFSVPKSGKVEPQISPQPRLEPQPSGPTAASLGASAAAAAAKSSSCPSSASSEGTWATSVGTRSAGSAVSRYCFSDAEETDVAEAEPDVDDGDDSRGRGRSCSQSRSRNSSRRSVIPQRQSDDGDEEEEEEEEDGDGDDGYDPDDDDDSRDGVDSRAASCKAARAATVAPSRSVAERTRSNTSAWSVKVMTRLQLLPDQDGRLRLPSILAFTHRRPPRAARTQAWWTKVKGVLVVAGQSITAGGSSLGRSLRRRGTGADAGGDSLRTRTACQSRSQSLAPDTDTENESYAYDGCGFADSPAAAAGGVSPAAAVKPVVPSAPSAAVVAAGTAAVTSQAAAVAERCSTPGCDMGPPPSPPPPQGAGAQPASKAGARPDQARAGAAGPAEATPGPSWQPHWLPPLTVIDAEGGGRGTGQRSLRPSAPGPAGTRTNLDPAAAAGAPHRPGSLRPRSHPQLQIPHPPQPQLEQAQPWPQEPQLTRTATMDFRRASGWGPDTQQHPAGMPPESAGGPLYGAGCAGGGGAAGGAERPSRSGRRTCSGGRTSGPGGRSPHTGLPAGSGGDRDWGPVDEESGWGACNCSLPGQLHSPCIPVG